MYYIENSYVKTIHAVIGDAFFKWSWSRICQWMTSILDPCSKLVVMPITQILHLQKESGVWIVSSVIQLIVYIVDFWNLIPYKNNAVEEREKEREIMRSL